MSTPPEPDREDDDDITAPVREFLAATEPRLEELRARGLDLTDFLADCRRFLAAQTTGIGEWFDSGMLLQRIAEVREEIDSYNQLQKEAERIGARASIPSMLDIVVKMIASLRTGDATANRAADLLEATLTTARERLARGEEPIEQLEDISLTAQSHVAELRRRDLFRTAASAIYWELQTPEWHAALPEADRQNIATLLHQWRTDREKHLSQLPLEDRHRLESLKLTDFSGPGKLEA